jgi:hypothetical protein
MTCAVTALPHSARRGQSQRPDTPDGKGLTTPHAGSTMRFAPFQVSTVLESPQLATIAEVRRRLAQSGR